MPSKNIRSVVSSVVFFVAIVGLGVWFFLDKRERFAEVSLQSWPLLVLLAGLFILRMSLRGIFQWQAMRALGASISLRDAMALCYTGLMLNTLLPMPVGVGYRAVYMRRVHDLPLSYFASTMGVLFGANMLVSCTLGLGAVLWLTSQGTPLKPGVLLPLVGVFVVATGLFLVPFKPEGDGWFARRTRKLAEGWRIMTRRPALLLGAAGVVVGSALVNVLAMSVAFEAYDAPLGIPGAFLLMSSQQLGGLIRLTPGAIGYQESVSAYFATMLTVSTVQAVVVLATTRAVNIVVSFLLGLPSLAYLSSRFPKAGGTGLAGNSLSENAEAIK